MFLAHFMHLTPDKWERTKELFEAALELDSSQRASFLNEQCRDESLRLQVEKLLVNYEEAGSFLDDPAFKTRIPLPDGVAGSPKKGTYRPHPQATDPLDTVTNGKVEDPMVGRRFGAYKLVRRVGQGGMGAVFLASRDDDEYHKQVAVKFLHHGFDSSDLLNRFRNERQTLAGLDHPNIVKLLDGGSTPEGLPFLVMDYVEGSPIDEYCDQLKLCIDERLHLFSKVCEAVQYAHQKFVVHRDLKPSNILVAADGTPRLLDFGIAKVLNSQPSAQALSLTKTGARYVTPAYASPEQMSGGSINTRADIYSLGVVLYELLTGHRPYRLTQQTPAEIERAICEQDPETPSRAVSRMETDTSSSGIPITKTPEAMSETREGDPQKLRRRLRGDLDNIVLKALQKEPQRRYDSVAEFSQDIDRHLQHLPVKARPSTLAYRVSKFVQRHKTEVSAAVLLVTTLGVVLGGMLWRSRQSHKLTEKDTIVLAGFVNSTGDPVFDGALRQGVSAQLQQSPFLNLLSDERVAQTLSRLAQPADAQLTHKLASEVCQRTASTATIEGSISRLDRQYVLGLKAVNCHNGDLLAEEQVTANDKEQVLKALGDAATRLRERLGESVGSVQKYDVSLEDVTTPSLEALNAYSLGRNARESRAAIAFFKRAVELDPNFAMAYRAMAAQYGNLGEVDQAAENARKAYERREKVSDRERLNIEISYYVYTTGELEKAAQQAEVLQQTYPKDYQSYVSLSFTSGMVGNWEKALRAAQEALRLDPNNAFNYWRVGMYYINLDRLNEAEAVFEQAEERKLDAVEYWSLGRYQLAFFEGDTARMKQLEAAAKGKPDIEEYLLPTQADTEAWYGKLKNARELTRQAMNSFQRNDGTETAASFQAESAWREAELGNRAQARAEADAALKLSPNRDVRIFAALALARAGDTVAAEKLAHELEKRFPLDTIVQRAGLPMIRAAVALQRKEPNQAVEILKVASGIELGAGLVPAYLRGEAHLMLHDGSAAAAEYQKLIDRRELVASRLLGALARLGLARAYSVQGDTVLAHTAYQDFLTLWKDADPDIPIMKKAKAEYAKLQ